MKKKSFVLGFLLLLLMLIPSSVFATDKSQDGLDVTITPDKQVYSQGDSIKANIKLINNNDFSVKNTKLESFVPEGFVLKDGMISDQTADILEAGESLALETEFVPVNGNIPLDNNNNNDKNLTNPPEGNGTTKNMTTTSNTPNTGLSKDSLTGVIVILAVIVVSLLVFFRKRIKNILPVFICLCLATSAVVLCGDNVYAEENLLSFEAAKQITYADKTIELKTRATYTKPEQPIGMALESDIQYAPVGEATLVHFSLNTNLPIENTISLVDDSGKALGEFEKNGDGGSYTLAIDVINDSRADKVYRVVFDNKKSNAVTIHFYDDTDVKDAYYSSVCVSALLEKIEADFDSDSPLTEEMRSRYYNVTIEGLEELKKEGKIQDWKQQEHEIVVTLKTFGEYYLYDETWSGSSGDKPAESNSLQSIQATGAKNVATFGMEDTHKEKETKKIASISTSPDQNKNNQNHLAEFLAENHEEYEYTYEMSNESVTLDSLKHLNDYSIIFWAGHGGKDGILAIGTTIDTQNIQNEQSDIEKNGKVNEKNFEQFRNNTIGTANNHTVFGKELAGKTEKLHDNNIHIFVTPQFWDYYYKDNRFLNDTLWYFGSCYAGGNSSKDPAHPLVDVLLKKGVSSIIAFTEEANNQKGEDYIVDVVNRLVNNETAEEAVKYANAQDHFHWLNGASTPVGNVFGDPTWRIIRYGEINGFVFDDNDKIPVADAKIEVFDLDDNYILTLTTNADGNFSYDGLPPGDYIVKATKEGYKYTEKDVSITNGQTTNLEIQLEKNDIKTEFIKNITGIWRSEGGQSEYILSDGYYRYVNSNRDDSGECTYDLKTSVLGTVYPKNAAHGFTVEASHSPEYLMIDNSKFFKIEENEKELTDYCGKNIYKSIEDFDSMRDAYPTDGSIEYKNDSIIFGAFRDEIIDFINIDGKCNCAINGIKYGYPESETVRELVLDWNQIEKKVNTDGSVYYLYQNKRNNEDKLSLYFENGAVASISYSRN